MRIFVLLTSISFSESFLRRRRRAPAPVPLDCELSDWQTVKPCSETCGPSGEEVQGRTIIRDGRNGGIKCSEYELERTLKCNRKCYNDGILNYNEQRCDCPQGWTGDCCDKDVDECKDPTVCSQICVNTPGSYYCDCNVNFTLDTDNRNCVDLEECQKTPAPCSHRCKEVGGGRYECYCDEGYVLDSDGSKCNDINECKGVNECQFSCINIPGDYQCECASGFFRKTDMKTCVDIDECAVDNGDCDQECVNTEGGYRCSCAQGYTLNEDRRRCDDVNECEQHGATLCEQLCVNVRGSYTCACVKPWTINTDMRTCSCTADDEGACESARERVAAGGDGPDKDTMYSWIIGVLLIACLVLVLMLVLLCYRKGYHRLLIPKPPPISTIPRHNNILFSPDLLDEGEASGEYEEPLDAIYEDLPDEVPTYMDVGDGKQEQSSKEQESAVKMAENDYVQATYDTEEGDPVAGPSTRGSMYVDSYTSPCADESDVMNYSTRLDDEGGFTFDEDEISEQRPYDNI